MYYENRYWGTWSKWKNVAEIQTATWSAEAHAVFLQLDPFSQLSDCAVVCGEGGRVEVCHTSDAVNRAWQLCNWTLDNFLEIFSSNLSSAQPVCKVVKGWLAAARWRNPSHCQQPPPSVILAAADLTSSRHFSREVWEISGEMWSGAIFAAECRCLVLSCILCSQHYNSPIVK